MPKVIDISFLGAKELERRLRRLPDKMQNKIVRRALRASNVRLREAITRAVSGNILEIQTGRLSSGMGSAPIRVDPRGRGRFAIGTVLPEREVLDISAKDKWYYPTALEYGAPNRRFSKQQGGGPNPLQAFRWIRNTVNTMQDAELRWIADEIGLNVTNYWETGAP